MQGIFMHCDKWATGKPGTGNRNRKRKHEFAQKALCCMGKMRQLLIKILLTKSVGMTRVSSQTCPQTKEHNDGLRVHLPFGRVYTAVMERGSNH